MILSAENIDAPKYVLVADTHAIVNGLDARSVDGVAGQYRETLERTLENLGLKGWEVVRASEIDQTPEYRDILNSVDIPNGYFRRELSDMHWFNQEHGVNLKVSWALKGSESSHEMELYRQFNRQVNNSFGFVYVVPGRTFNPKRPHAAPYFCKNPEERILIRAGENVEDKINSARERHGHQAMELYRKGLKELGIEGDIACSMASGVGEQVGLKVIKPAKKFIGNLVRLYDKTVQKTERGSLIYRGQQVLEKCTR